MIIKSNNSSKTGNFFFIYQIYHLAFNLYIQLYWLLCGKKVESYLDLDPVVSFGSDPEPVFPCGSDPEQVFL